MLAIRSVSAPTLLHSSSPCLRAVHARARPQSLFSILACHPHSNHERINKNQLLSLTARRLLPRNTHSDARKPVDSKPDSVSKPQPLEISKDVPSFLDELEKEEARFERDAAAFRSQTGMASKHTSRPKFETHTALDVSPDSSRPPPSFRAAVLKEDPTFEQPRFGDGVGRPVIWKQILFVFIASSFVFAHSVELTTYDTRKLSAAFPSPFTVSSEQLRRVRLAMLSEKLKKGLQIAKDAVSGLPSALTFPFLWSYVQLANGYINASEGRRAAYQIVAANTLIWALWQVRLLHPFMKAHFMHHPLSGKSYTLFTSIFSHHSFIHLLANSFALISFGSAASSYLVKKQEEYKEAILESTPKYHFWALFVSAGLFAALTSHVYSARFAFPRLLAEIRASKTASTAAASATSAFRRMGASAKGQMASVSKRDILPSLGASGAIYATVTLTALAFPDAQVFLLFPPIPLPITWGVGGMVALDIIGILRGWRLFDHWAHLGGAAFGIWYFKYGPDKWNKVRVKHAQVAEAHRMSKSK